MFQTTNQFLAADLFDLFSDFHQFPSQKKTWGILLNEATDDLFLGGTLQHHAALARVQYFKALRFPMAGELVLKG